MEAIKSTIIENSGADGEYLRLGSLTYFSKGGAFELDLNDEEAKHTKHLREENFKGNKYKGLETEISKVDVWTETVFCLQLFPPSLFCWSSTSSQTVNVGVPQQSGFRFLLSLPS